MISANTAARRAKRSGSRICIITIRNCDLELENLSVESLLLIYADFRVKSYWNKQHQEIIHFYTLKEAFDIILSKLDDVDSAKRQRYQKVYGKLADFEAYMLELGVTVELPVSFSQAPAAAKVRKPREKMLMEGTEVVQQLKYSAIAHNIQLMSIFRSESDFGNLIESARSEQNWKSLRTYISIFEEYSTYMTEQQKLMTLKFLFELLSHHEEDIRVQAAALMGAAQIIAVGTRPVSVKLAKEFGASEVLSYKDGSVAEQVLERTGGTGADAVIICGGDDHAMEEAIEMVRYGIGRVVNVKHYPGEGDIGIPKFSGGRGMAGKTVKLELCRGGRVRMERILRMVQYGRICPGKMITHQLSGFDRIADGLELMRQKPADLVKVMVTPDWRQV